MKEKNPSRRNFLAPVVKGAAAGAAAAAMVNHAVINPGRLFAASMPIPSIRIPKEVTETVSEPTRLGGFEGQGMTGAEVFAKACKDENLAALFCCPGNYPVIQAISAAGIPAYGGRRSRVPRTPRPGPAREEARELGDRTGRRAAEV